MAIETGREQPFFSQAWVDEVKECFNAPPDPEYRATKLELYWAWIENARAGFNGSVAFEVTGLPEHTQPAYALLSFEQGRCRFASVVDEGSGRQATFVLAATFDDWKEVIGGYDTSRALMERKLRLASGDPYEFYKLVFFFTEALSAIAKIPTCFPGDEQAA